MLLHLTIENFAIIDHIELEVGPGLVALTGETGAGKSIVIDAVGGLLGNRLGTDVIRTGASLARVEGVFAAPESGDLNAVLAEVGAEPDEGILILSREISRSGRSVARVNGRAIPVGVLQRIGRQLMDLHGQGEHLTLLRVSEHLRFLDGFAGLTGARAEVQQLVERVRALRAERASYDRDQRELARRVDLLRFQVEEITTAAPRTDEEEELRHERTLLANAERLASGADRAREALTDAEASAQDRLGEAANCLAELARIDPTLEPEQQAIDLLVDGAAELSRRLRQYREGLEFDPGRLEEIEERLALLRNLQRKYGTTLADVLAFAEQAQAELVQLEHREERVAELLAEETQALQALGSAAAALSTARVQAAAALASAIEAELAELNMGGARFSVAIEQPPDPAGVPLPDGRVVGFDSTGVDRVEFYIAPNAGEEAKPLVRVVSGGETARLMLAMKTILARVDTVPTLIFDEVDTGIGGHTAVVVGRKIANLARQQQIICVTHLSQIAAFADVHVAVEKQAVDGRTRTLVRVLDPEERVAELATMVGGHAGRASAEQHAREARRAAEEWKAERERGDRATERQLAERGVP